MEHLKFPIGQYIKPESITQREIEEWIGDIASFPSRLRALVSHLNKDQLALTYRPEGWMIKQVVHHCADSHMNSFIRFKLALTEDEPTIRPYYEDRWAELSDGLSDDLRDSLQLIEALHSKWAKLLSGLNEAQQQRILIHPEHGEQFTLAQFMAFYAWHCNHHLAHIELALSNA